MEKLLNSRELCRDFAERRFFPMLLLCFSPPPPYKCSISFHISPLFVGWILGGLLHGDFISIFLFFSNSAQSNPNLISCSSSDDLLQYELREKMAFGFISYLSDALNKGEEVYIDDAFILRATQIISSGIFFLTLASLPFDS